MKAHLFYSLLGYLSGSVLYAVLIPRLLLGVDVTDQSEDHNPGTFNVFDQCGIPVGIAVLACELLKAFLPVYIASKRVDVGNLWFGLVLAAPVIGHVFPIFFHFQGGKGIAAAFGSLIGLHSFSLPLLLLAGVYVFFSVFVRVDTHLWRSVATFATFGLLMLRYCPIASIRCGALLICAVVVVKHLQKYSGDAFAVSVPLLRRWKHAR